LRDTTSSTRSLLNSSYKSASPCGRNNRQWFAVQLIGLILVKVRQLHDDPADWVAL
jgi:hypothetical protein